MKICTVKKYLILSLVIFFFGNLNAQNAVETAANEYHQVIEGSEQQLLLAGKYAHALFFNGRQKEAMELLEKNIGRAAKKADGQYAAQLCGIAAMNSKLLEDNASANRYLAQARIFAKKTKELSIKGYVSYCEGWMHARNNQEHQAIRY